MFKNKDDYKSEVKKNQHRYKNGTLEIKFKFKFITEQK